jgi:ribosomal protein S18 acetylase RimI-like enzyme
METMIRRAKLSDCDVILDLLAQIENIHHVNRPDIFRKNGIKFTREELILMMEDDKLPIFVAEISGKVAGYCFCAVNEYLNNSLLIDAKTLHIEDLCVDQNYRGVNIGSSLIAFVKDFAKNIGCTRIDLDVWEFNDSARGFYEKHGFTTQKRRMEIML